MTYQKTVDEFNLAASDLISYATKYPNSVRSINEHFMYWMNELQELLREAA
jgi:hypothetical protein